MLSTPAQGCAFFSNTPDTVFAPEDFSGDEQLMIQAAEQFSRREVLPVSDRLEQKEAGLMLGLIRKAGELGFCGVDAPEAYGGLGLGKNLAARILEFLSFDASFSVTIGVSSGIGLAPLSWFGTDRQKSAYLPRVASGAWLSAYCLSEPNSGTDALSISTRAERRGDKWVLNGTKMWISNAQWADLLVTMAKVDGERLSAFLVEAVTPGIHVEREEHKLGLKGSSTARVVFEEVEIPLNNLLYEEGRGHVVAFNALNLGRFKLSAMSLGPARLALEAARAYAAERKQFGRPIAEFGLVQKKFALMDALFFAAESMIYRTGAGIDHAFDVMGGDVDGNRRAAEEYAVECSICKVFATEAEGIIVDEALQVFGGYGYTEEFPLARLYRDARVSRIYEGTNEINRVFISERLIRRAQEGRASLTAVGDSFISRLAGEAIEALAQTEHHEKAGGAGQIMTAGASDLLILAYAEQSARLRAAKLGAAAANRYQIFCNWANVRAAEAYQYATGRAIQVPEPYRFA